MNVSLTPELERFVRETVATGLYNNSSEVVREALRLLHAQRHVHARPDKVAIRRTILKLKAYLRSEGVKSLSLFGSIARGDAGPHSDVDVLIEVDARRKFNLLDLAGVQEELSKALGRKVDVVVKSAVRNELQKNILSEAERVF